MLQRARDYEQLTVQASDGELGSVDDFLFDDVSWTIRYIVVNTGLLGRKVAISPIGVVHVDWAAGLLCITPSLDQIRESPDLLDAAVIPRTREHEYAAYYRYPAYWAGPALWAWAGAPGALRGPPPPAVALANPPTDRAETTLHHYRLRGVGDLRGMPLHAVDGPFGHIDDAVVDGETWNLLYLLIDTSNWIGGTGVLIPSTKVGSVDWIGRRVDVDLSHKRIREAPAYDVTRPLDRKEEAVLAAYYPSADGEMKARSAAIRRWPGALQEPKR